MTVRAWRRTGAGRTGAVRLGMLTSAVAVAALAGTALAGPTRPDPAIGPQPIELPELSESARASLEATYLRPDERRDLRIRHGQATAEDLDTPARQARWALQVGDFAHKSLSDPATPALDRAEGALERGEFETTLTLVGEDPTMRAVRLRVLALEALGRPGEALAAAVPALNAVAPGSPDRPRESATMVDAVEAAAVVARLRPPTGRPGDEYRRLLSALRTARESLDRLDPRVPLAEARLLQEKDAAEDAQKALDEALGLNPRLAAAWGLLGRMTVNAFDLGSAEKIALRLVDLAGESSPLAAEVRARAMLRQNDPELAREALGPALAGYGRRTDLRALEAAATALTFDDAATRAKLDGLEEIAPRSPLGYYEAGRALSEARQYAWAARLLREAVARAPEWSAPAIDLGLLYVQSGEDEPALEILQKAAAIDPFNRRAGNSLTLVREMMSYERVETDHFVVRFQPGLDRLLAREMPPVLERIHAAVTGSADGGLRFEPSGKTFIDLMPNHRWFAVRIAGMPRIHTIAASTGPIIAMEAPREGAAHTGTYDWPRVLQHEYTHTVGLARTNNRIPHWFTEAQAVYLEHGPRDYPTCQLLARQLADDGLFDFTEINIAFVRPRKPTDRSQAYAQGHWMYEYLVHAFGDEAPLKLMDQYAAGVREEQAYRTVLGIGREEFFSRFRAWAGEQVIAWGLAPKPGVPTLEELLERDPPATVSDAKGRERPGDPDEAWVSKHLAEHPDHPDLLELAITQGLAAAGGSVPAELVPTLERYAAARPVDPMPHRHLARLLLNRADASPGGPTPSDALPHLEFLDAREDKKPTYAAQLAAIYAQAGDLERATAKADRAVRIAPYDPRQRELAAGIALQRQDIEAARRHIEALVLLEPEQDIHRLRLEAVKKLAAPQP